MDVQEAEQIAREYIKGKKASIKEHCTVTPLEWKGRSYWSVHFYFIDEITLPRGVSVLVDRVSKISKYLNEVA